MTISLAKERRSYHLPSSVVISVGQVALFPVQYSATSQLGSMDGRQTFELSENEHVGVQHVEDEGSQTEPVVNLHVCALQHVVVELAPGSQSSPGLVKLRKDPVI